jgi:lysophospholipase L1-like esterase
VANLGLLWDAERAVNPNVRIFQAKIIPNTTGAVDTLITQWNTEMTAAHALRSDSSFITLVDHNAAFKLNASWATDYMADTSHPNEAGYAVMSSTWITAINSVFA